MIFDIRLSSWTAKLSRLVSRRGSSLTQSTQTDELKDLRASHTLANLLTQDELNCSLGLVVDGEGCLECPAVSLSRQEFAGEECSVVWTIPVLRKSFIHL